MKISEPHNKITETLPKIQVKIKNVKLFKLFIYFY